MDRWQHVYYHTGLDQFIFSASDALQENDDNFMHVCKIEKVGNEFRLYKLLKESGEQND